MEIRRVELLALELVAELHKERATLLDYAQKLQSQLEKGQDDNGTPTDTDRSRGREERSSRT